MKQDLRATDLYREIETLVRALRRPGSGQISDAADLHVAPGGQRAVFSATLVDTLEGAPPTRIGLIDLASGETRLITYGPHIDRLPRFSPDGSCIAFLSDRHSAGDFQLYLLDPVSGAARATPHVEGWVEYFHWSPDGRRVLLGVAGYGADLSGGQGAMTSKQRGPEMPSWMPKVETGEEEYRWRRAWIYELESHSVRQVSAIGLNLWEVVWCGANALAAIASPGPSEGLWYSARLYFIDLQSGRSRELYAPREQLGWPAASPSGKHLAIVEAPCSDRWVVAGELKLLDIDSGSVQSVQTPGVDIAYIEWRSDQRLLLTGHRSDETIVGLYDLETSTFAESWSSRELTTGGRYAVVSGLGDRGDCALVAEGFTRAPEIGVTRDGHYNCIKSFDLGYAEVARAIHSIEHVGWTAPDGLEIEGWLLRPRGAGPHPLILHIHGGPVFHWRPRWMGRFCASLADLVLLQKGYALFYPNPRGSSGRGTDFARRVMGDMGGAETADHLSGLDYLVARGIADPKRLGVTGGSHGGFMTSWLITQDTRFAAAVSVVPITNHVSEHLISNIPQFESLFLGDSYSNASGKYFQRSPIMHAHRVRVPTLSICGALDRCTPPEEAVQFHNALLENGARSVLITYPEEGHGVRKYPATLDYATRIVSWFTQYMPA